MPSPDRLLPFEALQNPVGFNADVAIEKRYAE